jgi:maleylpyruvate isomerase
VSEHDGAQAVGQLIGLCDEAVGRLLASARALSDAEAGQPSLLPGWSRGHVLTHVARNADGLRNLLAWAQTGIKTPQYPSLAARAAEIEEGAARPAAELADDVAASAAAFGERARGLPESAWLAEVQAIRGAPHPAWLTLHRRLFEVEVHHVDLATGYRPADWPDWFIASHLNRISTDLRGAPAAPAAVLADAATGERYDLRPDTSSKVLITGRGHDLLAWLLGRDSGAALATDPPGPLPVVPPY